MIAARLLESQRARMACSESIRPHVCLTSLSDWSWSPSCRSYVWTGVHIWSIDTYSRSRAISFYNILDYISLHTLQPSCITYVAMATLALTITYVADHCNGTALHTLQRSFFVAMHYIG